MNVIVDTSVWIHYFAGKEVEQLELALQDGRVFLSPIVAAELLSGKMTTQQQHRLVDFLVDLPLCATTIEHWLSVGKIRSQLQRRGITISTPDAHVAQCAKELDALLLSHDKIFQRISPILGLRLAHN